MLFRLRSKRLQFPRFFSSSSEILKKVVSEINFSNNDTSLNLSLSKILDSRSINISVASAIFSNCSRINARLDASLVEKLTSCVHLSSPNDLSSENLSSICNSLKDKKIEHGNQISRLIDTLASKINSANILFSSREFSNAIYGLRNFDSKLGIVQTLILALSGKLRDDSNDRFSSKDISNCIAGLQKMNPSHQGVGPLLSILADRISTCKEKLSPSTIATALFGLQRMASQRLDEHGHTVHCDQNDKVSSLLKVLVKQIQRCNSSDYFDSRSINTALFGLQRMSSSSEDLRSLLRVLNPMFRNSLRLGPIKITNGLFGLQNMSSNQTEVLELLQILNEMIASSNHPWDPQTISCSLYGLRNMRSDQRAVREILASIAMKIRTSDLSSDLLDHRFVGMALFGMQGMNSEVPEVGMVLTALIEKIKSFPSLYMTPISISNSLYGLNQMISNQYSSRVHVTERSVATSFSHYQENHQSNDIQSAFPGSDSNSFINEKYFLNFLIEKTRLCKTPFNFHDISQFIYSLPHFFNPSNTIEQRKFNEFNQLNSPHFKSEVMELLSVITSKISQSQTAALPRDSYSSYDINSQFFGCHQVGNLFFGLRGLSSAESIVANFLLAILPNLRSSPFPHHVDKGSSLSFHRPMQAQEVAMMMYGLHSFSSTNTCVLQILPRICHYISTCQEPFHSKFFSMSMFGLQNLDSKHPEVRALLGVLVGKLKSNTKMVFPVENKKSLISFPPLTIAQSLYGLSSMSNHSKELEDVLQIICDNIESSIEYLHVSDPLTHSQSLSPKIDALSYQFTPFDLSRSLYGIQTLNPESVQVQRLLCLLLPFLASCQSPLDARDLGNAIYGLIGFNLPLGDPQSSVPSKAFSWRSIFENLFIQIESLSPIASIHSLMFLHQSIALVSNHRKRPNQNDHKEFRSHSPSYLSAVQAHTSNLYDSLVKMGLEDHYWRADRAICQRLGEYRREDLSPKTFPSRPNLFSISFDSFDKNDDESIEQDLKTLDVLYSEGLISTSSSYSDIPSSSKVLGLNFNYDKYTLEEIFFLFARMAFDGSPHVEVFQSQILYGFQADIIMLIRPPSLPTLENDSFSPSPFPSSEPLSDSWLINIEIDGPYHQRTRKQRFCALRDSYLQSNYNIQTIRLNIMSETGPWWAASNVQTPHPCRGTGPLDDHDAIISWFRSLAKI